MVGHGRGGGSSVFEPVVKGGSFNFQLLKGGAGHLILYCNSKSLELLEQVATRLNFYTSSRN